ncbi:VCBS repeat-containing protein [Salinimonas sp. HHU 13199]|uniref:VCBS repeat-containing protein n=1 Tax=Salinimonas profundi TaxID=2729140 RepID=A0ABR8LL06_9ALTE|nr:VCBS repeat-containing protein [Salinimonas profundi]MBD3585626.1 VCBS repeat-containing protein [Salinimonas profundi]
MIVHPHQREVSPPPEDNTPPENSPPPPEDTEQGVEATPSQIIADAKSYSTEQWKTAGHSLAENAYSGSTEKAVLDIALAQQVYRIMFDDNLFVVPELSLHGDITDSVLNESGLIDAEFDCDLGGSVIYSGQFEANGTGRMTMVFDNCLLYSNEFAISGVAGISYDNKDVFGARYSIYFDALNWKQDKAISLSGMMSFNEDYDLETGNYYSSRSQYLTARIEGETYLIDSDKKISQTDRSNVTSVDGRMSIGSRGYVDFSLSADGLNLPYLYNSAFYLNDDEAFLNFVNDAVVYIADTDDDGEKDAGRIEDIYNFLESPISELTLLPLDELSSPPGAEGLNVVTERVVASSDIVVAPGYYFDYETPKEKLDISYNWYINGVLLDDIHGDTLPAYSARTSDYVYVTMLVSDGTYTTESWEEFINFEESRSELTVSDVPEEISQGDVVTFSVVLTNADIGGDGNLAALTAAPEGATMSDDGTVTWQVPDNLLFSHQEYTFGFSNKLDPNNHIEESFNLSVSSDKGMPLFRTGIEVPTTNKSQWVADFDNDGRNELLSTDNYARIFLLALENGKYQQKWAYPYAISPEQRIVQVLPVDMDQNGTPEILVLSEHNMWLIEDLNRPARKIFETEEYLRSALLADMDDDGAEEIIYRYAPNEYTSDANTIVVAELDDEFSEIHMFQTDEIDDMAVGDVDDDSNLELVLNNGLVYDLTSGANEWYLGTGFGNSFVTAGDLNGDGIDEIVGVDNWSNMYVFDAVTKSQLASQAVEDTCDVQAFNLYKDTTDELIISDCQWGNATAYTLDSNNQLEVLWAVDLRDHGSTSLTVGDIDNDGVNEVLWGSGVSSSGANVLVTADITSNSASLKSETSDVQLDSFTASGWSDIFPGDRRGVFMVPTTGSSYDGLAVVTLTDTGEMTVNSDLSSGWRNGRYSATTDYNNDGMGDIFLPTAGPFTDGFGVYRLSDMTAQWTVTGDHNTEIRQIKAMDVNSDGYDDAIVVDGSKIKVLDVQNQIQLASYSFGDNIVDLDIAMIDGTLTVVVSQYDLLQVLTMGESSFSAHGAIENTECSNVLIYGEGESRSLVCWGAYDNNYWRTMTLQDGELSNLDHVSLDINVGDIVLDPSDATRFIVASSNGQHWGATSSRIHSVTADGHVIWSSPELVGSADAASLKANEKADGTLEILFGTSMGMYWIH